MENNQCLLLQYLAKRKILKPEELRNEMSLLIRENYSKVEEPPKQQTKKSKKMAIKRFRKASNLFFGYSLV